MQADVIVIGGGIAGASAAYFLSGLSSVALIEREEHFGYHSSGRTAAQFTVGISAGTMRRLAQASRAFLETPPPGFAETPILTPRGCLTVGRADQEQVLVRLHDNLTSVGARSQPVDRAAALALFPALVADHVDAGIHEPDAMDIDVNTLLQGYLRGAKARGARLIAGAGVTAIERRNGQWVVSFGDKAQEVQTLRAPLLLNAAGAWVDQVTALAGLAPLGIVPYRRTAFTFAAPTGLDTTGWPHVGNVDYQWYVKPETGCLMGSLADAVATEPGDVHPDDLDVAQAIYNIEQDTAFRIGRPLSRWAGLRSFAADKNPVAGTRPDAEGFFWLAGQGGCGILTSPAMGQAIAAIMFGRDLPEALQGLGVSAADLSPLRPTLRPSG
ncbi:MAG: FAD-binding oxidoreductase [Rhizobiales bacterium]|nr:FAD-binding oxidoreductase [Hyphomicrobiales bacterium]